MFKMPIDKMIRPVTIPGREPCFISLSIPNAARTNMHNWNKVYNLTWWVKRENKGIWCKIIL